ncbi:MAG: hypothetical protein QXK94_02865 [Candidatus Jordarchaeales archaeon]
MPLGVFSMRYSAGTFSLEEAILHDSKLSEEELAAFFSGYNFRMGRVEGVDIGGERVLFGSVGKGENVLVFGIVVESEVEEKVFRDLIVEEGVVALQVGEGDAQTTLARYYSGVLGKATQELRRRVSDLEEELTAKNDQLRKLRGLLEARYDEEVRVAEKVRSDEKALDELEQLFREEVEIEEKASAVLKEREEKKREMESVKKALERVSEVSAQVQAMLERMKREMEEKAIKAEEAPEEKFYTVFDVLKKFYGEENAILLEYLYIIKKPQTFEEISFHVKWGPDVLKDRLNQLVKEKYICALRRKGEENIFFTVCPSCPLNSECKRERKIDWKSVFSLVGAK